MRAGIRGWPRCGGRIRSTAVSGRAGFCEDAGAGEEVSSAGQGNGRRGDDQLTLRDFLSGGGFSPYFVRHFVVPVVSSVWSASTGVAMEYPARYLFVFLDNHGMLSVTGSPEWRTISGGSRAYVEQIAEGAARGAHRDTCALGHPEPRMGSKSVMIVTR